MEDAHRHGHGFARVYCNITITGLSVAIALIIGTSELLGLAIDELSPRGAVWQWIAQININTLGHVIVGLFVATWVVALLVWRVAHIEEHWSAQVGESK